MGVLNFSGPLHPANSVHFDILTLAIEGDAVFDNIENNENIENVNTPSRVKRKRTKSTGGCYDFRDYGVDARRRGSKHQRRKQNFTDLMQIAGDEGGDTDVWLEDKLTAFAELFMDEKKMKVWEGFMNLPEDKQTKFLEEHRFSTQQHGADEGVMKDVNEDAGDVNYLLVDKKIRDMLRSKKLADDGLLKYYEEDMVSCMNEWFSPVLVLNLDTKYDRMLVYGICQYMGLSWNTIKLKNSTILEIELTDQLKAPDILLTDYLRKIKSAKS